MIRHISRSGAIASAALMFALVSSTGLSGAFAQDQIGDQTGDQSPALPEQPTSDAARDSQLRFVAEAVVQALPLQSEPATPAPAASLTDLVSTMSGAEAGDNALSPELNCLAQAVYFEARGEPLDGQLAVARVIVNRSQSGLFPEDYCGVVTQRGQFSFVDGGRIPSAPASSPAWHRARAIARIAHQDLWDSEAADSLYFHNAAVRPGWARTRASVARIDRHIFYR